MTLPHLKEDILEFILNVKQLRLKIHTDEMVILNLEAHGKKTVKASDIKPNPEVEIVNPELEFGKITDMAGKINAKIYVKKGMGYVTIESREEKQNIVDYIEMDSVFSPIISVGIKIDNVRVGKMTNWEKLVLDLKTDGTMTPEEAFNDSVEILIKQFSVLMSKEKTKDAPRKIKEEEKVDDSQDKNRAGQMFREMARSVGNSKYQALGGFYRRIKSRNGARVANKATARKIAVLYYRLMKFGFDYVEQGLKEYEKIYQERMIRSLTKKAKQFGMLLIPEAA